MKTTGGKTPPPPKQARTICIWGDLEYHEVQARSFREALLEFVKRECASAISYVIVGNEILVTWPERSRSFIALELYQAPLNLQR